MGTTVQWEFFSTDYDISFEFHLKKKVADKTEKEIIVSVIIMFVLLNFLDTVCRSIILIVP